MVAPTAKRFRAVRGGSMVGSQTAWDKARELIEQMYDGVCTVYVYGSVTDPVTHVTHKEETAIYESMPCRISFKNNNNSLNDSRTTQTVSDAVQKIKCITNPDKAIPKGSKIVVTQNGVTQAYKSSSEPMRYYTHQEIILELFEKWT